MGSSDMIFRSQIIGNDLLIMDFFILTCFLFSPAGNSVEVDESLFQDIEDLDLDEDDPDFDPLDMGSDED